MILSYCSLLVHFVSTVFILSLLSDLYSLCPRNFYISKNVNPWNYIVVVQIKMCILYPLSNHFSHLANQFVLKFFPVWFRITNLLICFISTTTYLISTSLLLTIIKKNNCKILKSIRKQWTKYGKWLKKWTTYNKYYDIMNYSRIHWIT